MSVPLLAMVLIQEKKIIKLQVNKIVKFSTRLNPSLRPGFRKDKFDYTI